MIWLWQVIAWLWFGHEAPWIHDAVMSNKENR